MDTESTYRTAIVKTLQSLASEGTPTFERELVIDNERGRYVLFLIGWQGYRRIHTCLVHIDLVEDKVWIQEDGTESGITNRLIEAGIPKEHIVIGFHTPAERVLTEFAVG